VRALQPQGIELLRSMICRPAEEVDLASAALLIGLDEYPDLNIARYLREIEKLAADIRPRLQSCSRPAPTDTIGCINQHLFSIAGFRGNQENYYDPRNSFLNEVLDRRLGIPITLSVIYIEVGKRLGLNLQGVGMPGHFLVKYTDQEVEIFVDAFSQGEILVEADCQRKLSQIYGQSFRFERAYLSSVNNHQILARMLANLKAIYLSQQDYRRALSIIEKILLVIPDAPTELRDRGTLHYRLNDLSDAMKDWSAYLGLYPNASDAQEVRQNLEGVTRLLASRN
jgi:regulator of sirC expression with transglutaminase-like and TPR domain